ncbi:uncharacterized protein LOC122503318 [Leptopilina heterotoma]|uniref:uncharacterized protein LOC122503318 n=2 Tax=Leptopilina heterotoma TaxID=63436 RepID=UPI001CA8749C|nr:uncharacterized protein LOC122503318 [Leptopilina heterotoma]
MEGFKSTQLSISSLGSEIDSTLLSTSFFTYIGEKYGKHLKDLLKKWTSTNKQLATALSKKVFLLSCRNNNVFPQHIINLQKRVNITSFYSKSCKKTFAKLNASYLRNILNIEINDIHLHVEFLKKLQNYCELSIKNSNFNNVSRDRFFDLSRKKFIRILHANNTIHKNKLTTLIKKQSVETKISKPNWFKNLTDIVIPSEVAEVASLGPNFCFSKDISKVDIINTVKNLEFCLSKVDIDENSKNTLRGKFSDVLSNNLKNKNSLTNQDKSFSKKLNITKTFLKNNPELFFTPADKGNVTVLLKKTDYNQKMTNMFTDTTTYELIKKNPIKKLIKNTSSILKYLNENEFLDKVYHPNQLTLTDTVLAKAYGLPKIHKENVPLRPIISLINSPTHFLAKILYNSLKNCITLPRSHINNSLELKNKLDNVTMDDSYTFISLDVSSMFTNVSCELVIQSLDRRVSCINQKCKIPFSDIIDFTKFVFNNTYFSFDGKFYRQTYGTPMGSPISPFVSDIVMDDLETECLKELKEKHNCVPLFYYRYVDDTILAIKKEHVDLVIDTFNSYNRKLQFTVEKEKENSINFLDLKLIRDNNKIITNWYQKPISSDRLINYFSDHPLQQKKNIVYNLVDRAFSLSNKKFQFDNLKKIKNILKNNNYPSDFIEKHIKIRVNKIKFSDVNNNNNKTNIYSKIPKVCLPFNEKCFFKLSNILREFNCTSIPLINKNSSSIIKLGKDSTKKWDRTNVVYKFDCKTCPATYIGETKRSLLTRINEHKKVNDNSVVYRHCINFNHDFDWENVKVLDNEKNFIKRRISEMIHIKTNHSTINRKEDILTLNKTFFPLFRRIDSCP